MLNAQVVKGENTVAQRNGTRIVFGLDGGLHLTLQQVDAFDVHVLGHRRRADITCLPPKRVCVVVVLLLVVSLVQAQVFLTSRLLLRGVTILAVVLAQGCRGQNQQENGKKAAGEEDVLGHLMDFCVLYNQGPGQTVSAVLRTAKIAEASIAGLRLYSIVSAGNQPLVLKEGVKGKTKECTNASFKKGTGIASGRIGPSKSGIDARSGARSLHG